MEESFKPSSVSVNQLFGDPKILYRIPQYQRPYKWINEQVEQLWDDIYDAYENNVDNYFLGSVITARPLDNSPYIDVVDGQQRLTTLMILFCVLRDNFSDINQGDTENPFAIDIDAIKAAITLNNKAERLRLFTHQNHQSDFSKTILNEGATCEIEQYFKYQLKNDQEPIYKFRNTAAIFKEKLSKMNSKERGEFVNYLFNRVQLIRIDCSNRDFAIKLFQVLNDRGMDLTSSDLIKSYLIGNLNTIYKNDKNLLENYEKIFMADWQIMEETIKDSDINLNDLFTMYEYYLLASNPKKSLTEELQDSFKNLDPNIVISDIKNFAKIYEKEILKTNSKIIFSFRYLRWTVFWKTIVMTALIEKYQEKEELFFELRRFYYLYWIAGKTLSQIKQVSFNTIKAIKEKKPLNYIRAIFNNKLNDDRILTLVKDNLKSKEIDDEAWIKPLLIIIEYNLIDDSVCSFIRLDKDIHLEHILPKKYKTYKEWDYIDEIIENKWLRSIANLTLLSGKKNIEASNNPFSEKMKIYSLGYSENTTSFRISQHILNDYNNNKFNKKWNEEALKDRWYWILSQIEKVLDFDCTDLKKEGEPN
ncbi:MAG: DUF262 domain-containing HNH endonuclease family protein [Fusobacterium perfoetens]|uniref:DUF262 domain-containing protein n=1 Tax=Fusobacterium perfoetens TaxID=852 RepID=UPI0023F02E44|nr:DUF262 domain-containing HNH endonuclease family protein [Fusobacterium perfoetens]MCI6153392.1 DUF262 domain-containing HNH endonuclease family protein [Fusobacterium perfoetens]MDY3238465.1 DUF262 domain-containing HNH endonuclease family protein [Fusobacterium perfoetens]